MSSLVDKIQEKFGNLGGNPEANKLILGEVMQLLEDAYKPVKPSKVEPHRPSNIEYFEPKSEPEIQEIIRDAFNSKEKTVVRVVGAKHSWSRAISDADKIPETTRVKLISLTKFRGVEIDAEAKTVTALAGTNFGRDPENEDSTLENSLVYQLDKLGYALPDTGGIIHQTIGGFLSTGSAGGSLFHSLDDAIIGIRIIDGTGEIHDLKDESDEFLAAGVSMGLLGIITKVTFKLSDKFYVTGTQTITGIEPLSQNIFLGCPIDLFGDGDQDQGIPSISDFFSKGHNHDAEFSRLLWWPQPKVKRISIWKARSIKGDDLPEFHFNQYEDMEEFLGNVVLTFLYATERLDECRDVAACLVNFFNTVGINYFQDPWWKGLPMDNDIDFKALPVSFAELWIPFKETKAVMNSMKNLFIEKPESIDNFCNFFTEIYTAKKSKFWLSPGYHEDGGDAVRVNVTYFLEEGLGSPEEYFQFYWDDLKKFNYRCHWGKFTPEGYGKRVKTLYSKYDSWMKIRERMDPKQIFITPYWRSLLDIP